jgi:type II secretory pathway predicted ATPase ExeA
MAKATWQVAPTRGLLVVLSRVFAGKEHASQSMYPPSLLWVGAVVDKNSAVAP